MLETRGVGRVNRSAGSGANCGQDVHGSGVVFVHTPNPRHLPGVAVNQALQKSARHDGAVHTFSQAFLRRPLLAAGSDWIALGSCQDRARLWLVGQDCSRIAAGSR